MSGNRKARFIRAWQTYSVGQVITPQPALGETLVLNRICEWVEEEKQTQKHKKRVKKCQ